jgi:hypothetical protein
MPSLVVFLRLPLLSVAASQSTNRMIVPQLSASMSK